jgi:uncharacterized protein YigE (DUF2233 family)
MLELVSIGIPAKLRALVRAVVVLASVLASTPGQSAQIDTHSYGRNTVRVCTVDLRRDTLRTFWKDDKATPFGTFEHLREWLRPKGEDITCAMNGGIYQEDLRPLGLYVEQRRVLHRLNTRKDAYGNFYMEPNGVFMIEAQRARIVDTATFQSELAERTASIDFAIQSGPLMLQAGRVNPSFAPDSTNRQVRGAICVIGPQDVVLALAATPISFYEFTSFLREKLNCVDALHTDSKISRLFPDQGLMLSPLYSVIVGVVERAAATQREVNSLSISRPCAISVRRRVGLSKSLAETVSASGIPHSGRAAFSRTTWNSMRVCRRIVQNWSAVATSTCKPGVGRSCRCCPRPWFF